jgi:flagellum-specific peptidoglycan hydrolase FlgJ
VLPKGKAPMWEDMGRGNWATDPQYAAKINRLYDELLTHADKPLK